MKLLRSSFILAVSFLALDVSGFAVFPDLLDKERYDESAYERMLDQDDMALSRRREDPETDESFWQEQDADGDAGDVYVVSSSGGEGEYIDGIDIESLPPNYHKTITRGKGKNNVTIRIDKTTDPKTGAVSVSVVESESGKPLDQCTLKKPCHKGKYCHKLLVGSICRECRNVSQACGTNEECCGAVEALCVRGACKTGYKKGDAGTICKEKSDCDSGMCCSKRFLSPHGECQALARKGEKCTATSSELSLIMHGGLCPCAGGLKCSSGSWLESFFGGSMNTVLGGNTCRVPKKKTKRGWISGFFDNDNYDDIMDELGL